MKRDIVIRGAVKSDIDGIMSLEKRCFSRDAFSRRQMEYLISNAKGLFCVALADGNIVGYITLLATGRSNTGRIYSIAVTPGYRGGGVAGLLIDRALDYAAEKELRAVFLEVRTDNIPAIRLYEKKGFIKRLMKYGYYGDGTDAYSMVLESSSAGFSRF